MDCLAAESFWLIRARIESYMRRSGWFLGRESSPAPNLLLRVLWRRAAPAKSVVGKPGWHLLERLPGSWTLRAPGQSPASKADTRDVPCGFACRSSEVHLTREGKAPYGFPMSARRPSVFHVEHRSPRDSQCTRASFPGDGDSRGASARIQLGAAAQPLGLTPLA
jgi:hypothetical protein